MATSARSLPATPGRGRGRFSVVNRTGRPTGTGAVIAAAILAAVAGIAVTITYATRHAESLIGPVFNGAVFLLFTLVGAVIVAARPANRTGWAMLAGGALSTTGSACVAIARPGILAGHAGAAVPLAAIGGQGLRGLGWMSVTLLAPAFFPDVERPERRWLRIAFVVIAIAAVLDPLLDPRADLMGVGTWRNPLAPGPPWNVFGGLAFVAHIPLTLVATIAVIRLLIARWRTGDRLRRQQLLLFAIAAAVPFVAAPLALVTPSGGWIFALAAAALPITMGFAVLARGLYDLRSAVNRGLVWLTLSATVALLYAGVIGGAAALPHVDPDVAWMPWVAAIVVSLLFSPLRDALQRAVNRVTFGRWDEPYGVLAMLGQRLEASADADRLLHDVVTELRSLGLQDVSIHDDEGRRLAGGTGDPDGEAAGTVEDVGLSAFGAPVGSLRYRSPASPMRERDRQLIDDLARNLGGVVYARRLTRDLQHALERVVLGREEERRRLRRDLHDGLGPSLAGHVLRLDVISDKVDPTSPARDDIEALRRELRATVLEVRRVVEGLRPPALDELGLVGALQQVGARLTNGSGVEFVLTVGTLPATSAAVEVAAFRIVTEAVNNVVRHARASLCRTSIDATATHLRIVVQDDGRGLPDQPLGGHGMQTMRERAEELGGTIRVASGDGGVTITALLPLGAEPEAAP